MSTKAKPRMPPPRRQLAPRLTTCLRRLSLLSAIL
ncbi:unnamed protein product [Brassica rapa subsp. trilocularis]